MKIKQLSFLAITLLFSVLSFGAGNGNKTEETDEIYFPQIHFAPLKNRMGTPISLLNKDSKKLLFFQYNSENFEDGYYNWGLSTSSDGLHWATPETVVSQKHETTDAKENSPLWGSAIAVDGNTELIYNRWSEGLFRSTIEIPNTPETIVSQKAEFLKAEPFIFEYSPKNIWVMISYNRADSTMQIFNSNDRQNWLLKSSFPYAFGYPSLYELPLAQKPKIKKWILITESATYQTGSFDGETFVSDGIIRKFDYGINLGGSVCELSDDKSSLTVYTEMKHDDNKALTSRGMLSFPSKLVLHEAKDGFRLFKQPVAEIAKLFEKGTTIENRKIYPGIKNNLLSRLRGDCYYMDGVIDVATCNIWGFGIRGARTELKNELSYVVEQGIFSALGTGINFSPEDKKIEFKIIIDRSSIEIYLEEGQYCISGTFFPEEDSKFYSLITRGGEIMVDQLRIFPLKSIWNQK